VAAQSRIVNTPDPLIEIMLPHDVSAVPAVEAAARLPAFVGGPADAANRLRGVKALVVGAGSIGFEFVQQLARWQVASIGIVDPKKFKGPSLLTHSAPPEAVGQAKALYAAQLAKRLSPRTRVFALEGVFASWPLSRLAEFEVVFLATDNLLAELQVSRACFPLRLPVIHGSVHGETLSGHVRFYGHGGPSAACVACGFTREEWAHLNRSTRFSCEGLMANDPSIQAEGQPTMSVHALCSLISQLALLQFARDLLALGQSVRELTLEYCAYPQTIVPSKLTRHPQCPCPHVVFRRAAPPRPLAECTLSELSKSAAADAEKDRGVSFEVDEHYYVAQATCPCGGQEPVQRFVTPGAGDVGPCPGCRRPLARHPFHSFRPVPASALGPALVRPLREVGAADARWVVVRRDDDAVLFLNSPPTPNALQP
jgi:molybdopterin/thiamine biosynthesis adenylyltransferase